MRPGACSGRSQRWSGSGCPVIASASVSPRRSFLRSIASLLTTDGCALFFAMSLSSAAARSGGLAIRKYLRPQLGMASHVFRRVGRLGPELLRRVPGEARVPHRTTREADDIGLAGGDDFLALARTRDESHCDGRNARLPADPLRERYVVTRRKRHLLARVERPARAVYVVAAELLQLAGEHD